MLLEKLKKENNEKYKDNIMTKNALNKYWKVHKTHIDRRAKLNSNYYLAFKLKK